MEVWAGVLVLLSSEKEEMLVESPDCSIELGNLTIGMMVDAGLVNGVMKDGISVDGSRGASDMACAVAVALRGVVFVLLSDSTT